LQRARVRYQHRHAFAARRSVNEGWIRPTAFRGETTDHISAFLTCPPNAEVSAVHPKAMPVILTKPEE
jgi:putative SOS response-associated peptidase YedK